MFNACFHSLSRPTTANLVQISSFGPEYFIIQMSQYLLCLLATGFIKFIHSCSFILMPAYIWVFKNVYWCYNDFFATRFMSRFIDLYWVWILPVCWYQRFSELVIVRTFLSRPDPCESSRKEPLISCWGERFDISNFANKPFPAALISKKNRETILEFRFRTNG